jgi:hypothetical protein
MRGIIVSMVALGFAAALTVQADAKHYHYHHHGAHYRSTDGSWVHTPERRGHHGDVTAICGDGTHSYSHHHQGTCSRHHGVAQYVQ